jgi:two-component system chemotaxis response regulator CheY
VRRDSINLGGLAFLIADSNPFSLSLAHSILRGFGATKVTEVRDANAALEILVEHRPDIFLCDIKLPPVGGIEFIKFIRGRATNPFRTLPILAMAADTRVSEIKRTRDSGANMIITKPMSPAALRERLIWVAFNPRKFVDCENYFGPDRRFKIEGLPDGIGRRKEDNVAAVGEDSGPALSQSEIDNLFSNTRDS